MKRKYQIFVSSTYTDLLKERQAAVEAILKAGHIPAGMELFAAGDKSQLETIKKWIDASDIYMLILGARYGTIEPETNLSYTEVEYDYALTKNKPFFAIVIDEKAIKKRQKKFIEKDNADKLEIFRKKVLSKTSSFFFEPKDVKLSIHESINKLTEEYEFIGWVSGQYAKTEEELQKVNELYEYNNKLEKELNELKKNIDKDLSDLAQGSDIIELDFSIKEFSQKKDITWDGLFLVIANQCLKGNLQNSEKNIKVAVADFIGEIIDLKNRSVILENGSFVKNFEIIKTQFFSLDYFDIIMQSYSSENKLATLWNLTTKGKRHYSDILAIRKKSK